MEHNTVSTEYAKKRADLCNKLVGGRGKISDSAILLLAANGDLNHELNCRIYNTLKGSYSSVEDGKTFMLYKGLCKQFEQAKKDNKKYAGLSYAAFVVASYFAKLADAFRLIEIEAAKTAK